MQFFVRQSDSPFNCRGSARRGVDDGAAFTLIELLVVIAIIAILAGISIPAIRSLTKSNDTSQAANLVRSMIAAARTTAISQHRMAGVVFFEETGTFSRPVNSNQTAMQLFVEDYEQRRVPIVGGDQSDYRLPNGSFPIDVGATIFVSYSAERQYLPGGIKLAALSDANSITTAENTNTWATRAILFDSSGQLIMRDKLATPNIGTGGTPGTYPTAYGDWKFVNPPTIANPAPVSIANAASSPGFFLYNKAEFDQATAGANDAQRSNWIAQHSDVIIVNAYTGNVVR